MKIQPEKKMLHFFILAMCVFNTVYGQSQEAKLYVTKEDYIENSYQSCKELSLYEYSEKDQKVKNYGAFAFKSNNESLQRWVLQKVFLVEYNDSLYMNACLFKGPSPKEQFAASGFVRVKDLDGAIYFEAMQKIEAEIKPGFYFGIIGGVLIGIAAESERKKKAKGLPLAYYYYNPDSNLGTLISQEQLMYLLKKYDPGLYAVYKREPDPASDEVILLYARAFFEKREGREPDKKK